MKKLFSTLLMGITMGLSLNALASDSTLKDVQFKDLNNNATTLEQHITKGHKVYVKTWASWCPICLADLDEINELSGEKDKGFDVITIVSPDKKGEKSTQDFIDWYKGLDYKNIIVLLDENGETINRAKVRGYPSSVLLDENLNIIKTIPGHLGKEDIKALMNN